MNNPINFADHANLSPHNNLMSSAELQSLLESFSAMAGKERFMASVFEGGNQYHIATSINPSTPNLITVELLQLGADKPLCFYIDQGSKQILTEVINLGEVPSSDELISDLIKTNREAMFSVEAESQAVENVSNLVRNRVSTTMAQQLVPAELNEKDTQLLISVLKKLDSEFGDLNLSESQPAVNKDAEFGTLDISGLQSAANNNSEDSDDDNQIPLAA